MIFRARVLAVLMMMGVFDMAQLLRDQWSPWKLLNNG